MDVIERYVCTRVLNYSPIHPIFIGVCFTFVRFGIQSLHHKVVLLTGCRSLVINALVEFQVAVESHKRVASVRIKVAFCICSNVYIIANHCAAIVSTVHFYESLRRNYMAEFGPTWSSYCARTIGIIVYNRHSLAGLNRIQFLAVNSHFWYIHISSVQKVYNRTRCIGSLGIFTSDVDCYPRAVRTLNQYVLAHRNIDRASIGRRDSTCLCICNFF